jgi:hypothetical protein
MPASSQSVSTAPYIAGQMGIGNTQGAFIGTYNFGSAGTFNFGPGQWKK